MGSFLASMYKYTVELLLRSPLLSAVKADMVGVAIILDLSMLLEYLELSLHSCLHKMAVT